MDEEIFIFKFNYKKPPELSEFSESLLALSNQFQKHCQKDGINLNGDQVKLYISNIQEGSIIARFTALSDHFPSIVEKKEKITGFLKGAKKVIDFFLGTSEEKPPLKHSDLEDYAKILQPVVSDSGSNMTFIAEQGSQQNINITLNSVEANAIQNRIAHEQGLLQIPYDKIHRDMLYYCFQARDDTKSKAGDMGIIEKISKSPIKTIYASEDTKKEILNNPFNKAYIVDVDVQTIDSKPKLYKILEIKHVIDR